LHDYFHRYPQAGFGGYFIEWALQRRREPYNSWGNGSAMRVSPVGFAYDTLDDVMQHAERTAAVTHWNPPDSVFGPVWTTLFILMGIAGWLVWKPNGFKEAAVSLTLFGVQLVLNVSWSWIFFGMHQPGWAFVEIVVLWLAIVATTVAFFRRSQIAGWLMVPYLAWVSFAAVLNFTIWRLNVA
jgi:translocator protein